MVTIAGTMFYPTDAEHIASEIAVFVVEQFNHRVSKWRYRVIGDYDFFIEAGIVDDSGPSINPGTGYSMGDAITLEPPDLNIANARQATAQVLTVGGSGEILTVGLIDPGAGYNFAPSSTAIEGGVGGLVLLDFFPVWGSNGDGTSGIPGQPDGGGPTDNNLNHPIGICHVDTVNELWVTDTNNNRIRRMNVSTGAFIDSFGSGGRDNGEYYSPTGIDQITGNTSVIIADTNNRRVVQVDDTGAFQMVLGEPSPFDFEVPYGVIANDTNDNITITDRGTNRMNVYDNTFAFSSQAGTSGSDSTVPNQLYHPSCGHGIFMGGTEAPFADTQNSAVKVFDGTAFSKDPIGQTVGTVDGALYNPNSSLSFTDTVEYFIIANTINNRIEVFDATTFQSNFGTPV